MDSRTVTKDIDVVAKNVWKTLVEWVEQQHGGEIHEALTLDQRHLHQPRGVFAVRSIAKGEILIRLPATCVMSGASIFQNEGAHSASSWLKCVAAYYLGLSDSTWQPYRDSLPAEYETLFQWTNEQIAEFLAGTTLGEMVMADRNQDSLRTRYRQAVRPFLRSLDITIGSNDADDADEILDTEMQRFIEACMCISTRGFHLTNNNGVETCSPEYAGPFLLPVIDLLNHNPSQKCTTLQRDPLTGAFCMIAEKDIEIGEEIVHSYGDSLTAAQLLQTFGFVPPRIEARRSSVIPDTCLTPVVLRKSNHLLEACSAVKSSNFPKDIRESIVSSFTHHGDESEVWDVESIPNRPLSDYDAPDDWLISKDCDPILSDELITFMVLQFLPDEATTEIIGSDGRVSAWLDRSILEDVYLGSLVFKAIFQALKLKRAEYLSLNGADEKLDAHRRDISMLDELSNNELKNLTTLRKIWGLSVRVEEQLSLKALEDEVNGLKERLQLDVPLLPSAKRPRGCF